MPTTANVSRLLFVIAAGIASACATDADRDTGDDSDSGVSTPGDPEDRRERPMPDAGSSCAPAGDDCEASPCCSDSICIRDDYGAYCAGLCSAGDQCVSGCCAQINSAEPTLVCSAPSFCAPPPPPPQATGVCIGDLFLVADDGEFLGVAVSSRYATDGVCNEYSDYGSRYSPSSIYNEYGDYGSAYSLESAYSEYTTTPPRLWCPDTGEWWNAVTKNGSIAEGIDPDGLCAALERAGR